eukprot:2707322-Amphidinium_carterae.5
MKTLLPSTEYSRIGIAKDVMKQPRNGIPRDLTQAIAWLEDLFNLYTVAMSVKVMLEPKEVFVFVYNIVQYSFKNDMEMNMEWIGMKNNFKVTHKNFDHPSLETLLRELVVKLRMRKNISRVDQALGVGPYSSNRPGARSIEAAEANESPQRGAQGELCPLFDQGGHPRMHNKCLRCGSEEHLVKSCTRATRKREALAAHAEEGDDDPEAEEPEQEDDEPEAAQDEPEEEDDFEPVGKVELDPDIDDYEIQRTTASRPSTPMP